MIVIAHSCMHPTPSVAFCRDMVHQRNFNCTTSCHEYDRNMLRLPAILPDLVAVVPRRIRKSRDGEMVTLRSMKINHGRGTNGPRILYEQAKNDYKQSGYIKDCYFWGERSVCTLHRSRMVPVLLLPMLRLQLS